MILCVALLLTLMPTGISAEETADEKTVEALTEALPAEADTAALTSDVRINGEQFTSDKLTISAFGGTATLDVTGTPYRLTLNNVEIVASDEGAFEPDIDGIDVICAGIYTNHALNIVLEGNNRISCADVSDAVSRIGIFADGDLCLEGDGSLTVDGGEQLDNGIYVNGKLTLAEGGALDVQYCASGIIAKEIFEAADGDAAVRGQTHGITATEGSVSLTGNGKISVTSSDGPAISFLHKKGVLLLDGMNTEVSLKAGSGFKAVDNFVTNESPVGGAKLERYERTGSPDEDEVIYERGYGVEIDGVQFTKDRTVISDGVGTAELDVTAAPYTLILRGVGITGSGAKECSLPHIGDIHAAIYAESDLVIRLEDYNDICGGSILAEGDLTVIGEGELHINNASKGICAGGDITIGDRTRIFVDVEGDSIAAEGGVRIGGDGILELISFYYSGTGIGAFGGDIVIDDEIAVTIENAWGIRAHNGSVMIGGQERVSIKYTSDFGVRADGNVTLDNINGVEISYRDTGYVPEDAVESKGIVADRGDVTIAGNGWVEVSGDIAGIEATEGSVILSGEGGKVSVTAVGDGSAIMFRSKKGALLFEGSASPIALKTVNGGRAIWNFAIGDSPVGGSKLDDYWEIEGGHLSSEVIYVLYSETKPTPDTPETFSVSFNMNGHGSQIAYQTVKEGEKAERPEDPTASGYIFKGWYSDAKCTKAYDFDTEVTGDLTLYAKWVKYDPTVPVTGDGTQSLLYAALVLAAGAALMRVLIFERKRKAR